MCPAGCVNVAWNVSRPPSRMASLNRSLLFSFVSSSVIVRWLAIACARTPRAAAAFWIFGASPTLFSMVRFQFSTSVT